MKPAARALIDQAEARVRDRMDALQLAGWRDDPRFRAGVHAVFVVLFEEPASELPLWLNLRGSAMAEWLNG